MHVTNTSITIADYVGGMEQKQIVVNRDYQRTNKVWPAAARSFLIETILLGYPIPKLSLHQITDVKSRKTIKEIVDGQQRSQAILDFVQNEYRLSTKNIAEEYAGRSFEQLDDDDQHRVLDYALSIDLFVSATHDQIREVFRRINSYTVPLSPEEKRHAEFQGEFKWFIYHLSSRYDQVLRDMGVFTERNLARMADAKLFTEISDAIDRGIATTAEKDLKKLYEKYDPAFPRQDEFESRFKQAIATLLSWEAIHGGPLMKPYQLYSLLLAVMHVSKPIDTLQEVVEHKTPSEINEATAIPNLSVLAEAVDNPEAAAKRFESFILASSQQTNVGASRKTRFEWFFRALTEPAI